MVIVVIGLVLGVLLQGYAILKLNKKVDTFQYALLLQVQAILMLNKKVNKLQDVLDR